MHDRIIRLSEVRHRTGLSRSFIYAAIGNNRFPRQVRLGARAVGWSEHDIDAWMDRHLGRDQDDGANDSDG